MYVELNQQTIKSLLSDNIPYLKYSNRIVIFILYILINVITEGPTDKISAGMLSAGIKPVGMILHNVLCEQKLKLTLALDPYYGCRGKPFRMEV